MIRSQKLFETLKHAQADETEKYEVVQRVTLLEQGLNDCSDSVRKVRTPRNSFFRLVFLLNFLYFPCSLADCKNDHDTAVARIVQHELHYVPECHWICKGTPRTKSASHSRSSALNPVCFGGRWLNSFERTNDDLTVWSWSFPSWQHCAIMLKSKQTVPHRGKAHAVHTMNKIFSSFILQIQRHNHRRRERTAVHVHNEVYVDARCTFGTFVNECCLLQETSDVDVSPQEFAVVASAAKSIENIGHPAPEQSKLCDIERAPAVSGNVWAFFFVVALLYQKTQCFSRHFTWYTV